MDPDSEFLAILYNKKAWNLATGRNHARPAPNREINTANACIYRNEVDKNSKENQQHKVDLDWSQLRVHNPGVYIV